MCFCANRGWFRETTENQMIGVGGSHVSGGAGDDAIKIEGCFGGEVFGGALCSISMFWCPPKS